MNKNNINEYMGYYVDVSLNTPKYHRRCISESYFIQHRITIRKTKFDVILNVFEDASPNVLKILLSFQKCEAPIRMYSTSL